jgi:hypothetical protein
VFLLEAANYVAAFGGGGVVIKIGLTGFPFLCGNNLRRTTIENKQNLVVSDFTLSFYGVTMKCNYAH